MMRRRTVLLGAACTLAAPGVRAETAPGQLRLALAAPNTTMDPHLQSNAPNNAVASHIFDALVTNDEQSRSQPGLAESWRGVGENPWGGPGRTAAGVNRGPPRPATRPPAPRQRATATPPTAPVRPHTPRP